MERREYLVTLMRENDTNNVTKDITITAKRMKRYTGKDEPWHWFDDTVTNLSILTNDNP